MTTRKLFDELCALQISDVTRFLKKHEEDFVAMSIIDFVKEIDKISAKLPPQSQEKVEIILAYTLKELEEREEDEYFDIVEKSSSLEEKRNSDAKHEKHKKENIQHAMEHLSKELVQNPKDPQLATKRTSVQKQNHILSKTGK